MGIKRMGVGRMMKDYFSNNSKQYKLFRPEYPEELYSFVFSHLKNKNCAWDCGTGNGQVAGALSKVFQKVYATDISKEQINRAQQKENIFYKVEPAENTDFPPQYFDLITVAQAIHWFDFESFYKEVKRVLVPGGLLAIMGYSLVRVEPATDIIVDHFYKEIIGPFWDKERKYIDENYKTIPFPLHEISCPQFEYKMDWSLVQFIGYLNTWSSVKHYYDHHGYNPVDLIVIDLKKVWGSDIKPVIFPQLLRLGSL